MATTSAPARPTGLHAPSIRRCIAVTVEARGGREASAHVRIEGPAAGSSVSAGQQVEIQFVSRPGDAVIVRAPDARGQMIGLLITARALEALHAALGAAIDAAWGDEVLVEDSDEDPDEEDQ